MHDVIRLLISLLLKPDVATMLILADEVELQEKLSYLADVIRFHTRCVKIKYLQFENNKCGCAAICDLYVEIKHKYPSDLKRVCDACGVVLNFDRREEWLTVSQPSNV